MVNIDYILPPRAGLYREEKVLRTEEIENWKNQIHCCDSLEAMRKLPDGSVGAVVTSPPYNLLNSTGNGMSKLSPSARRGKIWKNPRLVEGYDKHEDNMPHDEYVKWQRECLSEMMRLLRSDGAIFYNHKWRVQDGLLQDRSDIVAGFPVRQIIIWHRRGGTNFNPGYFIPTYEVIYLIAKPDFEIHEDARSRGDVWTVSPERGVDHPAPFPVSLASHCISSVGNDGLILDPFMGSGTTAVAARNLGRDWIGMDNCKEYCDLARQRLAQGMLF